MAINSPSLNSLPLLSKRQIKSLLSFSKCVAISNRIIQQKKSTHSLQILPLLFDNNWNTRENASVALGSLAHASPAGPIVIPAPSAPLDPKSVDSFEYDNVILSHLILVGAAPEPEQSEAVPVQSSATSSRMRRKAINSQKKALSLPGKRKERTDVVTTAAESDASHWLFASAFVHLRDHLLDARWEVRHGAAIGLRELFAARSHDPALRQLDVLDDLFTRVLILMSRDRFVDFSGDTSVAPVRAAVATLVGAVVSSLSDEHRASILPLLVTKFAQLLRADEWQAQQGGLLALKFLCAVQAPSAEQQQLLVALVVPALQCKWEDVRFEATETLLALVEHRTATAAQCDSLLAATLPMLGRYGRYDMSGAIAGALRLVAEVVAIQHEQKRSSTSGGQIAPLVWPYLLHNIAAVRSAALETLLRLLELDASWVRACGDDAMRFTFQALFFATRDEHAALALRAWNVVCASAAAPSPTLVSAIFALLATPIGSAIDERHIVVPASSTVVHNDLLAGEEAARSSAPQVVTLVASTADAIRVTRALQCIDAVVALSLGDVGALDSLIQPMLRSAASQTVAVLLVGALPSLRSDATLAIVRALPRSWTTVRALDSDDMAVLFEALESRSLLPWHRCVAQTLAVRIARSIATPAGLDALRRLGALLANAPSAYATLSRADAVRAYDVRSDIVADGDGDATAAAVDPTCGAWRQRGARLTLAALLHQSAHELVGSLGEVTADSTPSALLLLGAVAAYATDDVRSTVVLPRLDALLGCVRVTDSAEVATTALAQVCSAMPAAVAERFVTGVLTLLHDSGDVNARRGGVYAVRALMQQLSDADAAVFVALFAPAMLTCMSDADQLVREVAAPCFANLVRLMPVESSVAAEQYAAQWFSESLQRERAQRRTLITQLLDGASLTPYAIPSGVVNATLRAYQQHGVNWLAFLRQYGMHGVLCDDMGLGKTLQTLCIVASDRVEHEQFVAALRDGTATAVGDSARLFGTDVQIPPSLIVCPPTLKWHWANECRQYCGSVLRPCVLTGSPAERRGILQSFRNSDDSNVLIASYEQVRSEIDRIKDIQFRYTVLDEGHVIKNAKSGMAMACKQIKASHRLLLSGTPVQNNVLELWSLFDFLMPGFLGSADEFNARYNRPITATRDARRVTSAQVAAAGQALTSLHRQVLPFVLRRLKADVLSDLPPKIIQDVECDMGDVQRLLIEQLKASAPSGPRRDREREFCNHPQAFLDSAPPALREQVLAYIESNGLPPISDLHHSPKLLALVDLLRQCGIGGEADVTSSHRVLIFAQSNKSLDLIAKLLGAELPQCSFVRLDSSVPQDARVDLATRFNQDPAIDVMLLTTSIGGHGLTLTGADTVIFFEHDWNPQNDNQAMDRAYRIGQRRAVSVYRLITRGTIEEDIMRLQHFKIGISNAVVNAENSNIAVDLNTNQVLDLYEKPAGAATTTTATTTKAMPKGVTFGPNGVPADAAQLESESQYDDFRVDKHVKRARSCQE
jgi:hypothetical protein